MVKTSPNYTHERIAQDHKPSRQTLRVLTGKIGPKTGDIGVDQDISHVSRWPRNRFDDTADGARDMLFAASSRN